MVTSATPETITQCSDLNLCRCKLIWELGDNDNPAWIHISYVKDNNRKLCYQAKRKEGKGYSTYHPFNLDKQEDV